MFEADNVSIFLCWARPAIPVDYHVWRNQHYLSINASEYSYSGVLSQVISVYSHP